MILAIMNDLIFQSKLQTTAAHLGVPLTVARDASPALQPGASCSRVLIDLNLSAGDPLAIVRTVRAAHPTVPVIGYCSHVQQELRHHALEAGCTAVLPRSAFVQQLSELLSP